MNESWAREMAEEDARRSMRSPRGTQGGDRHDKGARELEDVQGELIVIGGNSPADGTKVPVKRV